MLSRYWVVFVYVDARNSNDAHVSIHTINNALRYHFAL
jgi:hypothetical protein